MAQDRIITAKEKTEDKTLDLTLRPRSLKEFVGQEKIKDNLSVFMRAAKQRKEPIEHALLYGPPGIGKTTLAHIIANEMGVNIRVTSGPAIERAGDLGSILTNLEDGDILFIDEIHRLPRTVEEVLYPSMEEFLLDIVVGKGPAARTLRLELPRFSIIGATTRASLLSAPLRDRFGITYRLDFYADDDVGKIISRSAKILGIEITNDAVKEIAKRARRTPRVANRLLKRVRDFAQVQSLNKISLDVASVSLQRLEIDNLGLDLIDRRILETVIEKFNGGPVGINTIAAATSEERDTIEEIYEPFLLQVGFLARTPRGRVVTESAYRHLGVEPPTDLQSKLI
ncbi:MAG: Holliday junction branch migration DNA helicase RuvB [Candidatus Kerfeldbacteria bacterium CG_4_10_14_0_8_um_filter_42_10]|uniref:Holliday junction branch migration complex subunit RuvB n=1 Tax=Candidatus Kerfeldbacteria bacterium CG_4_10_14_0_8_um_filter_42_10 TaxID=2014248 RepID=A0A2M7RI41_9BACT|nr:MAG: Holliday junction branch migration DNA helicase RuvB [Candidatus Kerfeldbacteria bacterium CG_4_10_14_0_8_um_filter_42_10]